MRYIFDSSAPYTERYETNDKTTFLSHLKALPRLGKAKALEGFWDLQEVDMECDTLWDLSIDVADLGGLLYGFWMDLLMTETENRAKESEDGRCRIGFIEVVCEEGDE